MSDGPLTTRRVVVLTPWQYLGYVGLGVLLGSLLTALIIGTLAGKVGL